MKKIRWLCFIPFWGALIYIILVIMRLFKAKKGSISLVLKHLLVLGILSFASIIAGMFIVSSIMKLFNIRIDNANIENLIISLQVCLFAWPVISFVAIKLDKRVELLLRQDNSETPTLSN